MQETSTYRHPPFVRGLPLLGIALNMRIDPIAYLYHLHEQHGSVFRIKLLRRHITILAGIEANKLLATDEEGLITEPLFREFADEFNAAHFIGSMDGERLKHLRRQFRHGYSRDAILPHLGYVVNSTRQAMQNWQSGQEIRVLGFWRHLITEQLGVLLTGRSLAPHHDVLFKVLRTAMRVYMMGVSSRAELRRRDYQRAKQQLLDMVRLLTAEHRATPPHSERPANLIDDVVAARDMDGNPYSDEDALIMIIGVYFNV